MAVRDLARPTPDLDELLVQVAYSEICGSGLGGYLGTDGLREPPMVVGHEVSGTVAELGVRASGTRDLRIGQRVTANPLVTRGACPALGRPIRLFIVAVLRLHGVRTAVVVERRPDRLAAVRGDGVVAVRPPEEDPGNVVTALTEGAEVDVTFDAVGSPETRRACVTNTAAGGRTVLVGLHTLDATIPASAVILGEINCLSSFAYSADGFAAPLELLARGQLVFTGEVQIVPLADAGA